MAHKRVKFIDSNGKSEFLSLDDIKNNGYNKWKGWSCSAGRRTISINSKGSVFGSVCKQGGSIGNIYTNFKLRTEWITCDFDVCHCTDDIVLEKVKDVKYMPLLNTDITDNFNINDVVAVSSVDELSDDNNFRINWNIGKRCNFDCSYCPDTVHDNFSPHFKYDQLIDGTNNLFSQIPENMNIDIVYTGGEPTINPDFLKYVKTMHDKFIGEEQHLMMHVNTNGTKNKEYLTELSEICGLRLSVHFEFTKWDALYKKLEYMSKHRSPDAKYIVIKVAHLPEKTDEIAIISKSINDNFPHFQLEIQPLYHKLPNGQKKLMDYTN